MMGSAGVCVQVQLATHMNDRTKWEAVRLFEALRRREEETSAKFTVLMEQQQQAADDVLRVELRALEERHREEAIALEEEYRSKFHDQLTEAITQQAKEELHRLEAAVEAREAELTNDHRTAESELRAKLEQEQAEDRAVRMKDIHDVQLQIRALEEVFDSNSDYEAFSHQVHKVSVATMQLTNRIERPGSLSAEVQALRAAGRGDRVIEAALESIPLEVEEHGCSSLGGLRSRFTRVRREARRAGMVPSEMSGMVGHMFGVLCAAVYIQPEGLVPGDDIESVLSRAQFYLDSGDLLRAVRQVECLEGMPLRICQSWLEAARGRLVVSQSLQVLRAHVGLLAASLH